MCSHNCHRVRQFSSSACRGELHRVCYAPPALVSSVEPAVCLGCLCSICCVVPILRVGVAGCCRSFRRAAAAGKELKELKDGVAKQLLKVLKAGEVLIIKIQVVQTLLVEPTYS